MAHLWRICGAGFREPVKLERLRFSSTLPSLDSARASAGDEEDIVLAFKNVVQSLSLVRGLELGVGGQKGL